MKVLECMSGTGSLGRVFRRRGAQVVSLDLDPKWKPDICMDILDAPDTIGVGYQYIHFSPPCQNFSKAKTVGERDLGLANRIVKKCLKIIEVSKPNFFTIENPYSGLLPKQEYMKNIPYTIASYCRYGFPYRKDTIFFNNFGLQLLRCCNECDSRVLSPAGRWRHITSAQRGPSFPGDAHYTMAQLFRIAEPLLDSIYDQIQTAPGPDLPPTFISRSSISEFAFRLSLVVALVASRVRLAS